MRAIGLLMIEHRLIEKIIPILEAELERLQGDDEPNPYLIEYAVDFFRTYADRTHHGKEEDILFRELKGKRLEAEHSRIMRELEEEHVIARENVRCLQESKDRWVEGAVGALEQIKTRLRNLIELYPKHIYKEDKEFFFPVEQYFTPQELVAMLQESYEFDQKMIHEKYAKTLQTMKQMTS
jgi:hemerythrin-like domain-containing protein